MCFLHTPHFTLVNVLLSWQLWGPSLSWRFWALLPKGDPLHWWGEPQGSLEPCTALGKGCRAQH